MAKQKVGRTRLGHLEKFGEALSEEHLRLASGGLRKPSLTYSRLPDGSAVYDLDSI